MTQPGDTALETAGGAHRRSAGSSPFPARFSAVASWSVVVTAAAVLLGWSLDVSWLQSVIPSWPRMAPLTGLAFLLSGLATWCVAARASAMTRGISRLAAGLAIGIGVIRLCDHVWGWNLGLDRLWINAAPFPGESPSSTSPATAFNFVVLGSALLLARTKRFIGVFEFLALLGSLIGGLSLSRYVYGGEPLFFIAQMAVHTSALFVLLGAGILCLRPDAGVMRLILSDTAGGALVRRLLPPALIIPFVLGWLRLKGEQAGWYSAEAGVSLFAVSNVIVYCALIWFHGMQLHRVDGRRRQADRRLRAQLERMNLLQHITRAIGERQDLRSIFQVVIRNLEEQLPVDFVCICQSEEGGRILRVECVGVRSSELATELAMTEKSRVPVDENGLSRCLRGRLVYEPDLASVAFPFPQRLLQAGLRSVVIAPLQVESDVSGVLIAARREPEAFDSTDCEFLRQLSEHVALAAHHAQLLGSLQTAYDDLRQSEQAALQQERLRVLGQMASGIAHDINNALSPAALYADSLLEIEPGLSERIRSSLVTISGAIHDVAATVGRLREFYRPREPQVVQLPVDLNLLVRQVVELTQSRWGAMPLEHGVVIELVIDLEPDLPAVLGVESEIREALTNLIFNAVDAMPSGGTLTVRTQSRTDGTESQQVEIRDTGVGMDDETLRRCLEPFFTTKGDRGTGLGLAMVYGIVQRQGGELEIESAVGKGTVLRMIFSKALPANEPPGASPVEIRPPSMRLLIVDDDPILLRTLSEILKGDGHSVVAAGSGGEGVDRFLAAHRSDAPFDAVITDLGMPHVDGRKVARSIKEAAPSIPVLLLSGWGQRLAEEGDIPPHVDRVLGKPPKLRELRSALAECARNVAR